MAPLNIGYCVILFSLAIAQLTSSGGEVCDMQSPSCHTEEESEVAQMQTRVRGSKLLLQQVVERLSGLSGKPQKSKQHLEKITEDVKTLASQAIIGKRKSGNITGGGITDALTIDALNTMNDAAEEIVDQALSEAEALRNLLAMRLVNLQACEDRLVDPLDPDLGSPHDTCRQEETNFYVDYQTEKQAYEAAINDSPPPLCTKNWISTCTSPASTFDEIENSNERRDCLSSIHTWAKALNGSVQSVKASSYQKFVDKMTECNRLQEEYESSFCTHRRASVSGCQEALRCYEREKATYDNQAELVGSSSGAQKSAYAAGKKIQCLIGKLLTDLSETTVGECDAQVGTSSLDIEIQNLPSFPPWDCGLSLDPHPCTNQWMQIYFNKAWYKNSLRANLNAEYDITCRYTGCNDETYTQVYPGFPVAKGPDVWFKETNLQTTTHTYRREDGISENQFDALDASWVALGENAYECNVNFPLRRYPSVKQDSNSCLNTVHFPGGNLCQCTTGGIPQEAYRPNIDANPMEVWLVAKADNINGIQFMADLGVFPSNGLGFFFKNSDNAGNFVVAYAKNNFAEGDIPATSGLNVWRAQWKNYDSSERQDGYITVSLNNLVLANTPINSNIAIDYSATGIDFVDNKPFTLGGSAKTPHANFLDRSPRS